MKNVEREPHTNEDRAEQTGRCRLRVVLSLLLLAVGAFSREARADASPLPELGPAVQHPRANEAPSSDAWYGYQIVIADFFATGLLATGFASLRRPCLIGRGCDNDASALFVVMGGALYTVGGPALHASGSHWAKAGTSLALRVAPVASGMALSHAVDTAGVAPLLVVGGMVTAMAVDSTVLGYESVASDTPQVTFAPAYDPKSRSGALVVATTF